MAVNDNRGAAYVFHYSSATNQFVRVGRLAAPDACNGALPAGLIMLIVE